MFGMRNKKIIFLVRTLNLSPGKLKIHTHCIFDIENCFNLQQQQIATSHLGLQCLSMYQYTKALVEKVMSIKTIT